MVNGKQLVLYQGYTFYKRYERKKFDKWFCTSQPKCKSFLIIDSDLNIHDGNVDHNHKMKQHIERNGRYNLFLALITRKQMLFNFILKKS